MGGGSHPLWHPPLRWLAMRHLLLLTPALAPSPYGGSQRRTPCGSHPPLLHRARLAIRDQPRAGAGSEPTGPVWLKGKLSHQVWGLPYQAKHNAVMYSRSAPGKGPGPINFARRGKRRPWAGYCGRTRATVGELFVATFRV